MLWKEISYALRQLRKAPGFTFVAILTLALGIGGSTAVFTVVDSVVLKPLSHRNSGQLVVLWERINFLGPEKLVSGRLFEYRDRNEKTVIISEAAATAAWPGENPLGRQIQWRDANYTVIRIVADARNNSLKLPPANMVYFLYTKLPPYSTFFLMRSTQSSKELVANMRKAIWDYDPTATIGRIKSLDSQLMDSLAPERFHTLVLVTFGTAALFLAMLGIYGVLSYIVATRKQEIGVRIALGATRQRIYTLTMSEATIPVLAGLLGGWAASLLIGRVVRILLYGVKETDGSVAAIVAVLFLFATTLAAFLPAHRAATIGPMEALRTE